MKIPDYYIDEKIEDCYKKVINVGTDTFKRRIIGRSFIGLFLFSTCGFCYLIYTQQDKINLYLFLFLFSILLIVMVFASLFQSLDNKKYRYHGIELDKPAWFSFQRNAFREYNQIICENLERELTSIGLLLRTRDDIKLLDAYIRRFENRRKKHYREPIIISGRVSFFVLMISVGVQFTLIFFNKNEDTIYDLFLFLLFIFIVLGVIYFGLYLMGRFWQDISNRRLYTQDRICDFLEAIRTDRLLNNNIPPKEKTDNIFQCVLKRLFNI